MTLRETILITLLVEPVEEVELIGWGVTMDTLVLAAHDIAGTARVGEASEVATHLFSFDLVVMRSLHSRVAGHVAVLNFGPFDEHVVLWLVNVLIPIVDTTFEWDGDILPAVGHKNIFVVHFFRGIQVALQWATIQDPPSFEKFGSLRAEIIGEHATVASSSCVQIVLLNAEFVVKMLHKRVDEVDIIITGSPRASIA